MSFSTGDRVYVDPATPGAARNVLGKVWIVKRVNPVNIVCTPEDGVGRGINYPRTSLIALGADETPPPVGLAARMVGTDDPFALYFEQGEIVTAVTRYARPDEPLIVIRDNGSTVSAVRLGGDGGRYLRLAKSTVTKRDRAWLTETLVGAL